MTERTARGARHCICENPDENIHDSTCLEQNLCNSLT